MLAYADETPGGARPACCGPATPAPTPPPTRSPCSTPRSQQIPKHVAARERDPRARRLAPAPRTSCSTTAATGGLRFSVGYDLTEPVRAAILALPEDAWVPALDQDGQRARQRRRSPRSPTALDLTGWPDGSRVIVRRERPHPGAQLSFTDHDGHRFQAILTDQPDTDIAYLEARHRGRARVEDRIRNDKDTGLAKLPFRDFAHERGLARDRR